MVSRVSVQVACQGIRPPLYIKLQPAPEHVPTIQTVWIVVRLSVWKTALWQLHFRYFQHSKTLLTCEWEAKTNVVKNIQYTKYKIYKIYTVRVNSFYISLYRCTHIIYNLYCTCIQYSAHMQLYIQSILLCMYCTSVTSVFFWCRTSISWAGVFMLIGHATFYLCVSLFYSKETA